MAITADETNPLLLKTLLALLTLALPVAAWLMLVAAGALHCDALSQPGDRWGALTVGMLAGGIGVWLTPVGLSVILRAAGVSRELTERALDALLNAWLASLALLALACLGAIGTALLRGSAAPDRAAVAPAPPLRPRPGAGLRSADDGR